MSALRLLLDEDVRPLLADLLRERGFDVIAAVAAGLSEADDREVLQRAARNIGPSSPTTWSTS